MSRNAIDKIEYSVEFQGTKHNLFLEITEDDDENEVVNATAVPHNAFLEKLACSDDNLSRSDVITNDPTVFYIEFKGDTYKIDFDNEVHPVVPHNDVIRRLMDSDDFRQSTFEHSNILLIREMVVQLRIIEATGRSLFID